jgi:hypothetical protein
MAIKNLTRRLVETHKIKIGGHSEKEKTGQGGNKYRLPVKFNHFVVTGLDKDKNDNFIIDKVIMDQVGKEPKSLDIMLLSDDPDKNFMTAYQLYTGKTCACRGDGETASRIKTKDDNGKILDPPIYHNVDCNPETCEFALSKACKPSGILSCMIPQSAKIGGVAKFRTHSWNSIINILSSLETIKLITGGVLFGIPLKMELIEKQTEKHGKVKVVNIVYAGDTTKLQLEAATQKQLRLGGSVDMIKQNQLIDNSHILEDHDDAADVEQEFYNNNEEVIEQKSGTETLKDELKNNKKTVIGKENDIKALF